MTEVYKPTRLDRKIAGGLTSQWRGEQIEDPFTRKLVAGFRAIEHQRATEGQPLSNRMAQILELWVDMLPPIPESEKARVDSIFDHMIDHVTNKPFGSHAKKVAERIAQGLPATLTSEERHISIQAIDNRAQFRIISSDSTTQE